MRSERTEEETSDRLGFDPGSDGDSRSGPRSTPSRNPPSGPTPAGGQQQQVS